MELLQRVLDEQADELTDEVRDRAGLSRSDAARLVVEAGDDLIESYRWHAGEDGSLDVSSPDAVRDLLGGIRGREVAEKIGLPPQRTWDGIRALVPAVLESAARLPHGGSGGSSPRRFDVGFRLYFEAEASDGADLPELGGPSLRHPVFGALLPRVDDARD